MLEDDSNFVTPKPYVNADFEAKFDAICASYVPKNLRLAQTEAKASLTIDVFDATWDVSEDAEVLPATVKESTDLIVKDKWTKSESTSKDKSVRPSLGYCNMMFEQSPTFSNSLALDEFSGEVIWVRDVKLRVASIESGSKMTNRHILEMLDYAELEYGIEFKQHTMESSITTIAGREATHPVRTYLQNLYRNPSKASSLDTWMIDYLKCEDTPLNRVIGARFLISAVARVMEPGCQADHMLVLEGSKQGEGKSSAIKVLFTDKWSSGGLKNLTDKDDKLKLRGKWCMEMGEMSVQSKSRREDVKEFITERVDTLRVPYGRSTEDYPRQCVFVGTTNESEYLEDDVNRRYWPVKVGTVDLKGLAAAKDSIWAEAYKRYLDGCKWYISSDETGLFDDIKEAQLSRRVQDAWEEPIAEFLEDKKSTTLPEIYNLLGLSISNIKGYESKRIFHCLKVAGWIKKQQRVDGNRIWVYTPSE
jgi:putative DNA primase/helicase